VASRGARRAYRALVPYKPRDEEPGYHHVVARGNNKQRIFLTDADRRYFLALLDAVATKHHWEILAYCLMRNHYHLLVKVGDRGLSRGMCELNGLYALQFNRVHGRINHLFGRRFWNERLPDERRFLNVVRYIVQNPRRAGIDGPLDSHTWTSYRAAIGVAFTIARFRRDELLRFFGRSPAEAVDEFRAFCDMSAADAPGADGGGAPPRQPP
jgi:REP-associated tyrosine transposase